jgi:tRNA (uracil-5-)-methyltransferase TRM9
LATNRETFDRIAGSWYGFRHWPLFGDELAELASRWGSGRVVNLGCAHGPDFLPFISGFELHGVDFSAGMLEQARLYMAKHGFRAELVQADLAHLPYPPASFDYAVSVAAYHHIEEDGGRQAAFAELYRVLRPGGEVFLSVWNHLQPAFRDGPQDRLVPWRSGGQVLYRAYHLFTPAELAAHLVQGGFEVVWMGSERRHSGTLETARNICVRALKQTD